MLDCLIKLHTSDLDHQIVYFGTKDAISKFNIRLAKIKLTTKSEKIGTDDISILEVDESSEAEADPEEDLDESSSSP